MIFRSNFDKRYGHPNFVASLDGDFEFMINDLFEYFEGEIQKGATFNAGQTIQFGWMILMLKEDDRGDLELWEPDFRRMPINWVFSIDKTFKDLYLQREVCAQLNVEPDFPSLLERGIVSPGFGSCREFVINRDSPQKGDSGWLFVECANNSGEGKFSSLFEVAVNSPRVVPFLALPSGVVVEYISGKIEVRFRDRVISSSENQFLQRILDGWTSGGTYH
ncbi:immunity protein Imm33 domain-containing protein [Burkholderia sp. MSMB1835]|uniref:immunity protein Imm33 domain-containing protein n=1 Tax=Burkholderia sp. MSMB1835 TaxID=1637876 RepID=UPI000A565A48|nr:hypothetical protein [Burkholderia sp. MSMB1835]